MTEINWAADQAEDCLIGSILIESSDGSKTAIDAVRHIVSPADFRQFIDRLIFTAMLSCSDPPHEVNTARQMVQMKILEDGCISHMAYCQSVVGSCFAYRDYAKAVREYSQRREGYAPVLVRGFIE